MSPYHRRAAIVGGGAAGFFLAVNLKELCPSVEVDIYERSRRTLSKVLVSGGGRCNITNTFAHVKQLAEVYPRGHRLMSRLFREFSPNDARDWWEAHGVPLVSQPDDCIFPRSQQSQSVIDCLTKAAARHKINVKLHEIIDDLHQLDGYDYICITTGGMRRNGLLASLQELGHEIEPPCPSLFTFSIEDAMLTSLMGIVCEGAEVRLTGTNFRATGPLLITHWGLSGPAVLKLSSYAARHLAEHEYRATIAINWAGLSVTETEKAVANIRQAHAQKEVGSERVVKSLQTRLWQVIVDRALGCGQSHRRWGELSKRDCNRIIETLTNDVYNISGRSSFRDEFVTCGGISLRSVAPATLESRLRPNLYFAGEVLDIDGITGGFNFQAAWTTAMTVARAIAQKEQALV